MPMPAYPVRCYAPHCDAEAQFKVAARWSDGITAELKTYYLSCFDCLTKLFQQAWAKRDACRLAAGESLDPPAIYELCRGSRDRQLIRRLDLEQLCLSSEA